MSGFAALGYQILWAKMFALTLGHEFPAIVTVVAVFFIGMALGGAFANPILKTLGPSAFARLEFFIGAWALLTPLPLLKSDATWLVILAVLPATMAMGVTLPAMAQLARIPTAYAANTFGAVAGCLGAAYVLMPCLGFVKPVYICSACNFAAAFLARRFTAAPQKTEPAISLRFAVTFFVTGFLALGFETLGVRLLSLSLENTVFTFAAILAVYLFGQALGSGLIRIKTDTILAVLSIAMAISIWIYSFSSSIYGFLRHAFGDAAVGVFGAELLTTLSVFALPTFLMGGLFAQLAERAGERSLGRALLWNGLGATLGAIIVPSLLFPSVGAFVLLTLISVGYILLIQKWRVLTVVLASGAALVLLSAPRSLSLVHVPPGSVLREVRNGRMATVSVAETPDGNRTLFVNNRFQMGGTAAMIPELRHAEIPLLLHPTPRNLLVLGLGTGITLSAAAAHPNLHADGVELLPEVVAVMTNFVTTNAPSITIHTADARRFIRQTELRYDVIVADLFHPAQDGAAFLYTREHFQRIRERLSDDGLFCQWLPLHQLDLQTFRDITATFHNVYPNAEAWLLRFNIDAPVVGLIGWKGTRPPLAPNAVESRMAEQLAAQLRRVNLADAVRLDGCFLAGPNQLRSFAAKGRINSDTFPIVMFEAPRFSYLRHAASHERLLTFLDEIGAAPPPIADEALKQKVAQFIQARDVYLRALVLEESGNRSGAIDGYVESTRLSEEFTSGYSQCLVIASAKARNDPQLARRILQRLIDAQPAHSTAREMLDRLSRPQ